MVVTVEMVIVMVVMMVIAMVVTVEMARGESSDGFCERLQNKRLKW